MMYAGKFDEVNENNVSRRKFVLNFGLLPGSFVPLTNNSFFAGTPSGKIKFSEKLFAEISVIPIFFRYEHCGSIESMEQAPEHHGFRRYLMAGARPLRHTSVWDLFLDPYKDGWLKAGEKDPHKAAIKAGFVDVYKWWKESPQKALKVSSRSRNHR